MVVLFNKPVEVGKLYHVRRDILLDDRSIPAGSYARCMEANVTARTFTFVSEETGWFVLNFDQADQGDDPYLC